VDFPLDDESIDYLTWGGAFSARECTQSRSKFQPRQWVHIIIIDRSAQLYERGDPFPPLGGELGKLFG